MRKQVRKKDEKRKRRKKVEEKRKRNNGYWKTLVFSNRSTPSSVLFYSPFLPRLPKEKFLNICHVKEDSCQKGEGERERGRLWAQTPAPNNSSPLSPLSQHTHTQSRYVICYMLQHAIYRHGRTKGPRQARLIARSFIQSLKVYARNQPPPKPPLFLSFPPMVCFRQDPSYINHIVA